MVGLVKGPQAFPPTDTFRSHPKLPLYAQINVTHQQVTISITVIARLLFNILIKDKVSKEERPIDGYFSIMSLTFSPPYSGISSGGQDLRALPDSQRVSCNPEAKNPWSEAIHWASLGTNFLSLKELETLGGGVQLTERFSSIHASLGLIPGTAM